MPGGGARCARLSEWRRLCVVLSICTSTHFHSNFNHSDFTQTSLHWQSNFTGFFCLRYFLECEFLEISKTAVGNSADCKPLEIMKMENCYRVKIGKLSQVIEAENMDDAINKAKSTFEFRLYNPSGPIGVQKCCKSTPLTGKAKFSFGSGHITLTLENEDIFSALERAKNDSFVVGQIEGITSPFHGEDAVGFGI